MKNFIVNIFARLSGASKLLEGKKAYLGGAGLILTGAANVLLAVAAILAQAQGADAAGLVDLFQNITANPQVANLLLGASTFSAGLAAVGLRHKQEREASKPS